MKFKEFHASIAGGSCAFQKPCICPACGVSVDAVTNIGSYANDIVIIFFNCTDPDCRKLFFGIYKIIRAGDNLKSEFIYLYPEEKGMIFSDKINDLSPAFIKASTQAFCCEKNNHFELAVCGYRNSIEILVKDYAIKYKDIKPDNLRKKSLSDCIKEFLTNIDERASAFFIKQDGNDATHYPPYNETVDFGTFKQMFNYFISMIDNKIMIEEVSKNLPSKFQC